MKGKPFDPDARMKNILNESVATANAESRVITFHPRTEEGFAYYDPSSHWLDTLFVGGLQLHGACAVHQQRGSCAIG